MFCVGWDFVHILKEKKTIIIESAQQEQEWFFNHTLFHEYWVEYYSKTPWYFDWDIAEL